MVDAAQYIWWPRMHRDNIQLCKDFPQCTKFEKKPKAHTSFNSSKTLPLLSGPDYAGPLPNSAGKNNYILVAIDLYSQYPSAMITRSTGGKKIVKFMKSYIQHYIFQNRLKQTSIRVLKINYFKRFAKKKIFISISVRSLTIMVVVWWNVQFRS